MLTALTAREKLEVLGYRLTIEDRPDEQGEAGDREVWIIATKKYATMVYIDPQFGSDSAVRQAAINLGTRGVLEEIEGG